jgi:hypothetical protein
VAYDGSFATDPLATYLPGVPWTPSGGGAPRLGEIDVVGYRWQAVGSPLPTGTRLIGTKVVNDYLVARFAIDPSQTLSPSQILAGAPKLLGPAPTSGVVLVQHPS